MRLTARPLLLALILISLSLASSASAGTRSGDAAQYSKACANPEKPKLELVDVSADDLENQKAYLTGDWKLEAPKQELCIVALWRAKMKLSTTRPVSAPKNEVDSHQLEIQERLAAVQNELKITRKDVEAAKSAEDNTRAMVLALSTLTLVVAVVALVYSRSATREALRAAGLL